MIRKEDNPQTHFTKFQSLPDLNNKQRGQLLNNQLDCARENCSGRELQIRRIREKVQTEKCFVTVVGLKKVNLEHLTFFH